MKQKDSEPCGHPGCLNHVTHPCEGCGRVAGHSTGGILKCWCVDGLIPVFGGKPVPCPVCSRKIGTTNADQKGR